MRKAESKPIPPVQLSAATAFVVHVGAEEATARRIFGRVEHVASGNTIRFGSVAELVRFMRGTLGATPVADETADARLVGVADGRTPRGSGHARRRRDLP